MFRPIYEPRTKAREYCDLAVNIYTGCTHGCIYCYAPNVLRKTREEFATKVEPRKDIVESIKKQIIREGLKDKKIMLCFTCDPYPFGIDTSVTREVIKVIKDSGNHVQILTKSGYRAIRDFDLLDKNDSFGVTISCNNMQKEKLEPKAAHINLRLSSLHDAKVMGLHTWVSCEPVYDVNIVYDIIKTVDYIDMYRIGKLNYAQSNINWGEFGRQCEKLCKEYGRNYYLKEDLRAYM